MLILSNLLEPGRTKIEEMEVPSLPFPNLLSCGYSISKSAKSYLQDLFL
jgi:hypothetical protein